ncbi:MAG TPA: M4 family metallopeptidase, partial [Pedococcus sp.]|nr:M4 family metallopeptidase [Pedococcus sp.]
MSLGSCSFVPPFLLERIAASSHDAADHSRLTLARDQELREGRLGPAPATSAAPAAPGGTKEVPAAGVAWVVHTADNGSTLPGDVVRSAGDPTSGDASVDEAADGVTATLDLYQQVYSRSSYDDKGAQVVLTVHYEQDYDNAFWNGEQLVFGDGDGKVFGTFTKPIDVLGHEFTHAVTQFTAALTYQGQSGALNESVSDCFGMCVKQRVLG